MGIQKWSENIMVVDLPQEPQMVDELKSVISIVRDTSDCDVVVDFSVVDIITSSSLSALLRLHKLLTDSGHKLVLCCVPKATKNVFTITGIDELFSFTDDKFTALASLQMVSNH